MLDNVLYNPSKRIYEVATDDGEVETFPAGKDGRREAFQTAVGIQSPALYRFVNEFIRQRGAEFESRAWKAAELVLIGAVSQCDAGNIVATVKGSSEYGPYQVRVFDGIMVCDCMDYDQLGAPYDENGQPWCKSVFEKLC